MGDKNQQEKQVKAPGVGGEHDDRQNLRPGEQPGVKDRDRPNVRPGAAQQSPGGSRKQDNQENRRDDKQ